MVFVSTHNAFNYKKGPNRFWWPNQRYPIKRQLADGVRNLMLDVYDIKGTAYLYHANPKLGKEKLRPTLNLIKEFLDKDTTEILSIIFQNGIDNGRIAAELDSAGLTPYCLAQPKDSAWPTLAQMVATNHRLVIFVEVDKGTQLPHILSAWDYIFDTPWNTQTIEAMDTKVGRGKPGHGLFLLNNWISKGKPNRKKGRMVNNEAFLLNRLSLCAQNLKRVPNFIGVNFYSEGDVIKVVKMLNEGLRDTLLGKVSEEK